jgi:methylated-DNA-[protein]-cysteine S-methyltransferase
MKASIAYYQSPIGAVEILGTQDEIFAIDFVDIPGSTDVELPVTLKECVKQVDEYFNAEREEFSVKLSLRGTDFQISVWRQLLKVPYAKTVSYGEIAAAIGNPAACRAVGAANGKNPISIIVPCHRIIGSDGSLTGYGGGLWRKEWLLKHERAHRDKLFNFRAFYIS